MKDNRIFLRVIFVASDPGCAQALMDNLKSIMSAHGGVTKCDSEPYWKIKGRFSIYVEIEPVGDVKSVFERLLTLLGTGWLVRRFPEHGDWAVWNDGAESSFLIAGVEWANLECF
jgi:hypothetical protein